MRCQPQQHDTIKKQLGACPPPFIGRILQSIPSQILFCFRRWSVRCTDGEGRATRCDRTSNRAQESNLNTAGVGQKAVRILLQGMQSAHIRNCPQSTGNRGREMPFICATAGLFQMGVSCSMWMFHTLECTIFFTL